MTNVNEKQKKMTKKMYDQTCRLCLEITSELTPIFGEGSSICDTIMTCNLIEISDLDEYPKHICLKCEQRLDDVFEFKKMCQASDEILRQTASAEAIVCEEKCNLLNKYDSEVVHLKQEYLLEQESSNDSVDIEYINIVNSYCETVLKEPIKSEYNNEYFLHTQENTEREHNDQIIKQSVIENKEKLIKQSVKGKSIDGVKEKKHNHKCFFCGEIFNSKEDLKNHKSTHLPPFICRFCGQKLSSLQTQKRHENRHQTANPGFDCQICGLKLSSRGGLRGHISTHTGDNMKECDICCKQVSSKNLKRHKLSHLGSRPFPCTLCEKDFTRTTYLKIHMDKHRDPDNPHKCSFCNFTTPRIQDLWKHKELCNPSTVRPNKKRNGKFIPKKCTKENTMKCEQFLCKYCGKAFGTKASVSMHELIHTGQKPFACSTCSKPFRTKIALIRHERIHSGERPYKCKICTKSFNQNTHLKKHLELHSGHKKFSCNICDKKFYQADALRYHTMTHTGERPFICSICDKGFYIKYRLKVHMTKFHRASNELSELNEKE